MAILADLDTFCSPLATATPSKNRWAALNLSNAKAVKSKSVIREIFAWISPQSPQCTWLATNHISAPCTHAATWEHPLDQTSMGNCWHMHLLGTGCLLVQFSQVSLAELCLVLLTRQSVPIDDLNKTHNTTQSHTAAPQLNAASLLSISTLRVRHVSAICHTQPNEHIMNDWMNGQLNYTTSEIESE